MSRSEVEQPTVDIQIALDELLMKSNEVVDIKGRKASIGWLKYDTERKFTHIMLKSGVGVTERIVKAYSIIALDVRSGLLTFLLQSLFFWIYWRWVWYVRRERGSDFQLAVIRAAKKKVNQQSEALALSTILLMGMVDTMMTMARHESGRAGRSGELLMP